MARLYIAQKELRDVTLPEGTQTPSPIWIYPGFHRASLCLRRPVRTSRPYESRARNCHPLHPRHARACRPSNPCPKVATLGTGLCVRQKTKSWDRPHPHKSIPHNGGINTLSGSGKSRPEAWFFKQKNQSSKRGFSDNRQNPAVSLAQNDALQKKCRSAGRFSKCK